MCKDWRVALEDLGSRRGARSWGMARGVRDTPTRIQLREEGVRELCNLCGHDIPTLL